MVFSMAAPAAADHATRTNTDNLINLGDVVRDPAAADVTDLAFWGDKAYVGAYNGWYIVDITDKDAPVVLDNYDQCDGNQGDLMVWEDLLFRSWNSSASGGQTCGPYTMAAGEEGIHAFDVSDPTNPVFLDFIDLVAGSHTATLVPDIANDRLFIYNGPSSSGSPGIDIIEVELDDDPTTVGVDERGQMTLVRRENTNRSCHDNSVFLGSVQKWVCAGGNGFTVLSMDPADGGSITNPQMLYSTTVPDVTTGHSATFTNDGKTFVFGHEPGGGVQASCEDGDPDAFRTFWFFDTATGEEQGKWEIPVQGATENCTPHNMNVIPTTDGSDVMVSGNYQAGTWVTDFTDRKNPEILAYSDPPPLDPVVLIPDGTWSSYWYDGYIYEADIRKGLHIFQIENPTPGVANYVPESFSNPQTQLTRIPQTIATASDVSIVHRTGPDRFGGKVTSDDPGGHCTAGRTVVIKKAQDGPDRWVGRATTDELGGYRIPHTKGGRGTYYAVAQPGTDTDGIDTWNCARAKSGSLFVRQ
jgi:hypothetical protein